MTHYFLSSTAEKDVDEIVLYLAEKNISSARNFLSSLHNFADLLVENPFIGHARKDLTDHPVLFYTFQWHYLVIYKPNVPVEIVRVLSGHRDIANIINNNG